MPEVRLIDANAAADKIMHDVEVHADEIGIGATAILIAFARALRDETDFPTIEPEVRHGRCQFLAQKNGYLWKCSNCKGNFDQQYRFCPYCGASMQGGADNG